MIAQLKALKQLVDAAPANVRDTRMSSLSGLVAFSHAFVVSESIDW